MPPTVKNYHYYVYILTNKSGTLYAGISKDARFRQWQHEHKVHPDSFTAKYNIHKLIYCEEYQYIEHAILREKQIKRWSRKKKLALIRIVNPKFEDLLSKESEV